MRTFRFWLGVFLRFMSRRRRKTWRFIIFWTIVLLLLYFFILDQLPLGIAALFSEILYLGYLIPLFFLLFLIRYLFANFLDSVSSESYLILYLIDFILCDIPTQVKQFISIFLHLSLRDLQELFQVFECKVGLLGDIEQSFISYLHISY